LNRGDPRPQPKSAESVAQRTTLSRPTVANPFGVWCPAQLLRVMAWFTVVHLRLTRSLVILVLLVAGSITSPTALAASGAPFCADGQAPLFTFGFADLKAAIGDSMGDPVECEHASSANGDTLQQTTTGLAIYRHSTNTSEFTDGWNHWALTSDGLVAWSGTDSPISSAAPASTAAATQCVDVGGGVCLNSAADLADTVSLLAHTRAAAPLLRNAATAGYTLGYGDLPTDILGLVRPSRKHVTLSTVLQAYSTIDRAPVLAHELQHVSDWISHGELLDTTYGCLATEANAFHTESATWLELSGGQVKPANDLEREFNMISEAITTDPAGFASRLTLIYHDECAPG
jgi:hypothetical protein